MSSNLAISIKTLIKKVLINNQIVAENVRVIDENGKQLGIFSLKEALQIAQERNLDLILVTEKAQPPVCKLGEYGKYLYWLQKKEKGSKKISQVKVIRLGFNISQHDLEIKAKISEKFLKKGDKIKVELILRGREKGLEEVAKEKIERFLEILRQKIPIKIEGDLKKEPKGFVMIITKS